MVLEGVDDARKVWMMLDGVDDARRCGNRHRQSVFDGLCAQMEIDWARKARWCICLLIFQSAGNERAGTLGR